MFGAAAMDMCLVSDLVMPAKFKTHEFEKYKGHICPKIQLVVYYRNMASYTKNHKLLIHSFQYSMSGTSMK